VRVREIVAKSNRQSVGNVLIKEDEQIWAMDISRLWSYSGDSALIVKMEILISLS
jgi:hypothetical protein